MASKIGKKEWLALFIVTGIIDAVQFFADLFLTEFFAAPEIINEIADPFIGIGLVGYFELRGVQMVRQPKRLLSLLGVTGLEELTGGLAPAWIIDVWYIHNSVKKEDAGILAQKQELEIMKNVRQPANVGGRRMPNIQPMEANKGNRRVTSAPLNVDGIRVARRIDTDETLAA